jgi:hypothetical protein
MRLRSGSVLLASLVALMTGVSLVGDASAAPGGSVPAAAPESLVAAAVPGAPPRNAAIPQGNYFSYPNKSTASKLAIRNRVLNTINSTWGHYVKSTDNPDTPEIEPTLYGRGTIRMTTWSFGDSTIKDALIAAKRRGTQVQVVAARSINNDGAHPAWPALKRGLNAAGDTTGSFARECSGACRGPGGAAHSKYFLFNDVGSRHRMNIVVQTSANLTRMAYQGQWNQATVWWNPGVHAAFDQIFDLSARHVRSGYRAFTTGGVTSIFFPGGTRSNDPILRALNRTRCRGATAGGIGGRTRVRLINYAIYQGRGTAIAKRLRALWNAGCNVRIIYSVSSRPVLRILRARSGRGPIPMRQSVIKNRRGDIVKYNHSKWLAISGVYSGRGRGVYTVLPGSANWSDLPYRSDEQTQQIFSRAWTAPYFRTFDTTWRQRTSRPPAYGRIGAGARTLNAVPEQPTWGRGEFKYLSPEGG